ncbi:MAG: bifunctional precorrin-2 dehydrogenase/sirohydrochlorin ferrochelatase [Nitrososphaeraceae archaeon]|nr:bifunctional precorrin-2 dehydrogenase/sirohydrochlorin ferrochelatase [Nitrososphaeraceae archaeon]MDW3603951.1 bifunctional precorrin-2 dehydrogenase/sirohydrochlorin ferrochelatase [Nitrososphaeraceae archaeon]MDW3611097.1 bifunctional precorrin-2 dehydrogenase/sirohydrochlorin ferrochelatase [Nitrososphaeraceae archaeon]MDW3625240.1 bifunctional precorrin-2 dehydrogenase/sirohydrochlorin ferrochelatase [Nitrososphaeraceae archaeon]
MIVDLNLAGKNVIVIGGGVEGVRKVKGLLGQNCKITVISERLNSYLEELAQQKKIEIVKMKIKNANVLDNYQNIFLVLAATDNKELNRKIVEKGRSMMSFVYAADDPPVSDFSYASIINIEGIMQVAISTFGKSPIMARRLRIKAERILRRTIKQSDIENTKLQEFARMAARPKIKTVIERKRFLYSIIKDKTIQNLINENKIDEAKVVAIERLNHWSDLKK